MNKMKNEIKIDDLTEPLLEKRIIQGEEIKINRIVFDSRKAEKGCLFVAVKGSKSDGHKYIDHVIDKGAKAVVVEEETDVPPHVALIRVPDTRKALAELGARFYDYPANKLKLIGITGTNGKTTTSYMISSILRANGQKTGLMGTINIMINDEIMPARITTPESLEIQEYLARMVDKGADTAIMEVSSHALHFERVAGLRFDRAVFTNLSQDHLDFHRDLDEYFEEKLKLFQRIRTDYLGGCAVVNSDSPRTPRIIQELSVPSLSYGIYRTPDLRARNIHSTISGTGFTAEGKKWDVPINMRMVGEFNIYNALAAAGVALSMNIPPKAISDGLASMGGVRGRFEIIDEGQDFGVVVDYAHTPDGLMNVLRAAKELTHGRLIAVFGCGGDRDRTKRPLMGQIAAEIADLVIITSDNPRTEDPAFIMEEIRRGVEKEKHDHIMEVDRKKAIFKAVEIARSGDVIVIAGKGHETYQLFKNMTIHFDDGETAREALLERLEAEN